MERLETHVMRLGGSSQGPASMRLSLEIDQMSFRTLDSILGKSRVYRRLVPRSTRFSFDSDRRTTVSSIFANFSLSEISNISMLEVPLWAKDVGSTEYFKPAHMQPGNVQGIRSPIQPPEALATEVDNDAGLDRLDSGIMGAHLHHVIMGKSIQDSRGTIQTPRIFITDVNDATGPAPLDSDSPGRNMVRPAVYFTFPNYGGSLTVPQTNLDSRAHVRDKDFSAIGA